MTNTVQSQFDIRVGFFVYNLTATAAIVYSIACHYFKFLYVYIRPLGAK